MQGRHAVVGALLAIGAIAALVGGAGASREPQIQLAPAGVYETGIYDEVAAEIAAFDPKSERLFVTNSADGTLDVLDASDPETPTRLFSIDLSAFGGDPTSVAVHRGLVAVALVAEPATDPGTVAFFDVDGDPLGSVTVGSLPDMVVFIPNGRRLLVANEGEPSDDYAIDPAGTVAVIDLPWHRSWLSSSHVELVGFEGFEEDELDPSVRIFGPGASVAQDLEPEYIAVSKDGRKAWVTLQEGNAIAELDLKRERFTEIYGLGFKDHSLADNGLDASDRDGPAGGKTVNIRPWPVLGMYQPDALAAFRSRGRTYLVTANEGDARDYSALAEEVRVGASSYILDPATFPDAATLKASANLGRLTVTSATGDTDGDGDYDRIHSFGGRSFSIWESDGDQVWDSGERLERLNTTLGEFNSDNAENDSWDTRSDNKGPEPEGVTVGEIGGRSYAFVGLERIGGVAVYDVSKPRDPLFVQYLNRRDFSGDAEAGTAGDLGPEGLLFIPKHDSPVGSPLLVVTNEVSGSTRIFDDHEALTPTTPHKAVEAAEAAGRIAPGVGGRRSGRANRAGCWRPQERPGESRRSSRDS